MIFKNTQGPSPHANCCYEELRREYEALLRRHETMQPTRKRLSRLAIPKHMRQKYQAPCACNTLRKTEIIRAPDCATRTEQLAYPHVARMLVLKEQFATTLGPDRMHVLNRTIRKSILSVYSRLASIQVPKKKIRIPGWSKKQWLTHTKYLNKLAMPKRDFGPPKRIALWKDLSLMKRYKTLCLPKQREEQIAPEWKLTPAMKNYEPTDRMLNIAKAKEPTENIHYQPLPVPISPDALTYKATARIKTLATAREVRLIENDLKENPFGIAPNALKAKASERVVELAQPKEYSDTHTRENPFAISPAALKAKPSARTMELAKPKEYNK